MEDQNKRSILTSYSYSNDNATFLITLQTHLGFLTSYDFITPQQQLREVLASFLNSLIEPVAATAPISLDILVYTSIPGTQKLYPTSYRAEIELTKLSFDQHPTPFYVMGFTDFNSYEEFSLSEKVSICRFNNFKS